MRICEEDCLHELSPLIQECGQPTVARQGGSCGDRWSNLSLFPSSHLLLVPLSSCTPPEVGGQEARCASAHRLASWVQGSGEKYEEGMGKAKENTCSTSGMQGVTANAYVQPEL